MVVRHIRRLAQLAILLSALTSCFIEGFDTFPSYLTDAEAVTNLSDVLKSKGFTGSYYIQRMEYLTSPTTGTSRVLISAWAEQTSVSWQSVCIVLDSDLNTVSVTYQDGVYPSSFLGVDCRGNFLWGNYAVLANGTIDTTFSPSTSYTTVAGSSNSQQMVNLPFTALDVFLGGPWSSTSLYFSASDWSTSTESVTLQGSTVLTASTTATVRFLDACPKGSDGGVLLFSYDGRLVLVSAATATALASLVSFSYILDDTSAVWGPYLSDSSSTQAWATKDGIVMLNWNQSGKLVRYSLSAFSEQDSQYIDNNSGEITIAFSNDGRYWLYLNSTTGKLFKLRTWWK